MTITFLFISREFPLGLKLEYIVRKPMKRRFQQYLIRMEILSTFQTQV